MACALLACGGPMFAGTYEGQSGLTGTCTVNGRVENLPSETVVTQLTLTESGSLVRFGACGGEATASARIGGNVAQLEPLTCPPRVTSSGATQTLVLTGGTLTLSGMALVIELNSRLVEASSSGTVTCTATQRGTLARR
jgi:hypothetical protein